MSEYTISVYQLKQNGFDFGLDKYEIFDENYRPILNNAILEHYLMREISYQNPAYWKERLNARMDLIMRNKYNALYKAKAIEFNPLFNIDLTETFEHSVNSTGSETSKVGNKTKSNDSTNNLSMSSRFPSEEMTEDNLTSNLFVDTANKIKDENKTETTDDTESNTQSSGDTVETYQRKTEGSSAGLPFSKAMIQLKQFYDKYDLDRQVIAELSDLFMNIW